MYAGRNKYFDRSWLGGMSPWFLSSLIVLHMQVIQNLKGRWDSVGDYAILAEFLLFFFLKMTIDNRADGYR